MENQFVLQLVFDANTTEAEITVLVQNLYGLSEVKIESAAIKEFNPEHGGPVIYFP